MQHSAEKNFRGGAVLPPSPHPCGEGGQPSQHLTYALDASAYSPLRQISAPSRQHILKTALDTRSCFRKSLVSEVNVSFLQRVGIACYADAVLATGGSVCLSSVTRWYCVETYEATIMRFSPSGRTIILVSGQVKIVWKFAGNHP